MQWVLEAGKVWGGQQGYLQCRGAHLQPTHRRLKGLTPLLLPVNGILEGLEGKAGLEGQSGGLPLPQAVEDQPSLGLRHPNWGE